MKISASSLQHRLSFGLTVIVAFLWLAASLVSGLMMKNQLDSAFDSGLEETAQRILPLAITEITNREDPNVSQQIALLKIRRHKELLSYLIRDSKGNVLLHSHDLDFQLFGSIPRLGFLTKDSYRIYGESAVNNTIFIEVAEPMELRISAIKEAIMALLLPLIILIPVSFLGIWYFVKLSLRSVLTYRYAIEARGAGSLTPISVENLPMEIKPVSNAVNQLMQRLRYALESERNFTANSAHELRTPLAASLAQVQRLRKEVAGSQ